MAEGALRAHLHQRNLLHFGADVVDHLRSPEAMADHDADVGQARVQPPGEQIAGQQRRGKSVAVVGCEAVQILAPVRAQKTSSFGTRRWSMLASGWCRPHIFCEG